MSQKSMPLVGIISIMAIIGITMAGITITPASSQEVINSLPTLSVSIDIASSFVYIDDKGHGIMVGMAKNTNSLIPVSDVVIQAKFFDDSSVAPLEIVQGTTSLENISPGAQSPFLIRTMEPHWNATEASATVLGFLPAGIKNDKLDIHIESISHVGDLQIKGVLNNGGATGLNGTVYLAFHDVFDPPRILDVRAIQIGDVAPDSTISFEFEERINPRVVGVTIFAETDTFSLSNPIKISIPPREELIKMATIVNVKITDDDNNKLSKLKVGDTLLIESEVQIKYADGRQMHETPYIYYTQIKEASDPPRIIFLGKYEGRFVDVDVQSQVIDWIPDEAGLFYIETYIWERDNTPLGTPGPLVLILVE